MMLAGQNALHLISAVEYYAHLNNMGLVYLGLCR